MSIPTEVFAILVSYGLGITSKMRNLNMAVWETNMDDDLPWSLYDEMDGGLQA